MSLLNLILLHYSLQFAVITGSLYILPSNIQQHMKGIKEFLQAKPICSKYQSLIVGFFNMNMSNDCFLTQGGCNTYEISTLNTLDLFHLTHSGQ